MDKQTNQNSSFKCVNRALCKNELRIYMCIHVTNWCLPNFQVSKEEEGVFFVVEKTSPLKQNSKKGFRHQFGSQYSITAKWRGKKVPPFNFLSVLLKNKSSFCLPTIIIVKSSNNDKYKEWPEIIPPWNNYLYIGNHLSIHFLTAYEDTYIF